MQDMIASSEVQLRKVLTRLLLPLLALGVWPAIAQGSPTTPSWVTQILQGPDGKANPAHTGIPHRIGDLTAVLFEGGSAEVVATGPWLAAINDAETTCKRAGVLEQRGELTQARDLLWKFTADHPDTWDLTIDEAIEASLATGRYREALGPLCSLLKMPGRATDQRFAELAVAAAGARDVAPGQGGYVLEKLKEWYAYGHGASPLPLDLRAPTTARDIEALGLLALGMRSSSLQAAYLESCISRSPGRAIAGRELVQLYTSRGEYSNARRVCDQMAQAELPRADKEFFHNEAKRMRNLSDRPAIPPR